LTFGLVITVLVHAFGNISGAHFNPAMTLMLAVARRFPRREIAPYMAAQLLGATVGSLCVLGLFPGHATLGATLPSGGVWQSFFLECILTWILGMVVLNATAGSTEKCALAPLTIGGAVGLGALIGGPISGASMNPARSFGPALASLQFEHLWLYFAAPVVGALLAVPCTALVRGLPEKALP
jgi:aquaporin Z